MSDPVSGIVNRVASQTLNGAGQQPTPQQNGTGGGRSFESVLQNGNNPSGATRDPLATPQISGARLEQMRVDLTRRLDQLPPGQSNLSALLPELLDTRSRMGLLRDAINGAGRTQPGGMDLRGRLGQLEANWQGIEQTMRSSRDLSSGELLSLQARLYQVSQHIEVMSKVVDQMTGGIKTILNTNV